MQLYRIEADDNGITWVPMAYVYAESEGKAMKQYRHMHEINPLTYLVPARAVPVETFYVTLGNGEDDTILAVHILSEDRDGYVRCMAVPPLVFTLVPDKPAFRYSVRRADLVAELRGLLPAAMAAIVARREAYMEGVQERLKGFDDQLARLNALSAGKVVPFHYNRE